MEDTNATTEILNDLILINNDRIAGYEKAIHELEENDADLKSLFQRMIDQSRQLRNALGTEVQVLGGTMAEGTMASGKIYRAWMDIKALFSGHDRHAILANCERGEDAAQKAYRTALEEEDVPAYLKELIIKQQQTLKYSHDEVKSVRDQVLN